MVRWSKLFPGVWNVRDSYKVKGGYRYRVRLRMRESVEYVQKVLDDAGVVCEVRPSCGMYPIAVFFPVTSR
jgi:hypothetical protein